MPYHKDLRPDKMVTAVGSPSQDRERAFREAYVRALRYRHGHILLAPISFASQCTRFAAVRSQVLNTRRILIDYLEHSDTKAIQLHN